MYPIHIDHPDGAPNWAEYTDADLLVVSSAGNGSITWTQTKTGSTNRITYGRNRVNFANQDSTSSANNNMGFRPVLEIL